MLRVDTKPAKIRVPAVTPTPQSPVGFGFGAALTVAELIAGRDLMGKTVVVTGGYSGIGMETVRAFRSVGAKVVVPEALAFRTDTMNFEIAGEKYESTCSSYPAHIDRR